jgi:hypothetical protein
VTTREWIESNIIDYGRNLVSSGLEGARSARKRNLEGTRHLTGDMAREAKRNINAARDAHWLEKNPIDYA